MGWLDGFFSQFERVYSGGSALPARPGINFIGATVTDNPSADRTDVDLSAGSTVPGSRQIIAGAGLTGGGNLTADRTLTVVANVDGSIVVNADDVQVGILANDTQHGSRGGGSQHAVAIASGAAGFMSGAWAQDLTSATSSATASTLAKRDGSGAAAFAGLTSPSLGTASGDLTLSRAGSTKAVLSSTGVDITGTGTATGKLIAPIVNADIFDSKTSATDVSLRRDGVQIIGLSATGADVTGHVSASSVLSTVVDSSSAANLLLKRNGSLVATVGAGTFDVTGSASATGKITAGTEFDSNVYNSNGDFDVAIQRNGVAYITLNSAVTSFAFNGQLDGIGATSATLTEPSIYTLNSTPASDGSQQASPTVSFYGTGFSTTDTASKIVSVHVGVLPVQSTQPYAKLRFCPQVEGVATPATQPFMDFSDNSLNFDGLSSIAATLTLKAGSTTVLALSAGSASLTGNLTISGLTASQAVVTNGSKQLTSLAYTDANTVSALVQRDASGNFSAGAVTATSIKSATLNSGSATDLLLQRNSTTVCSVTTTGLSYNGNVSGATLAQSTGAGAGGTLTVKAQNGASGNLAGGFLQLEGGTRTGSGLKGGVRLCLDGSTSDQLLECVEVAASRRVLSLCRSSALTTTEMPASTGDLVIYVGNAASDPAANPVSGGIMYASGGAGKWRGSSGTTTTFANADPHCPACGRDFALEWTNEGRGEHLAVCIPCLLGELASAGIKTPSAFIRKGF